MEPGNRVLQLGDRAVPAVQSVQNDKATGEARQKSGGDQHTADGELRREKPGDNGFLDFSIPPSFPGRRAEPGEIEGK